MRARDCFGAELAAAIGALTERQFLPSLRELPICRLQRRAGCSARPRPHESAARIVPPCTFRKGTGGSGPPGPGAFYPGASAVASEALKAGWGPYL